MYHFRFGGEYGWVLNEGKMKQLPCKHKQKKNNDKKFTSPDERDTRFNALSKLM